MDKLDNSLTLHILEDIVVKRIEDYRYRTTISWHRYRECGANEELCRKIYNLFHLLIKKENLQVGFRINGILSELQDLSSDSDDYTTNERRYVIPYNLDINSSVRRLKTQCEEVIFPLKDSSDESISDLVLSIEDELNNVIDDCKKYIFEEPYSPSFNPDDYHDICINDEAPIAYKIFYLEYFTAALFQSILSSDEETCSKLINSILNETTHFFKPYDYVTASDAYNMAQQLPRILVRTFFRYYEPDIIRYSQLLSSLLYEDEREFITRFHEGNFRLFSQHYNFLRLALDYFKLFSQQSQILPDISKYISEKYEYPYHDFAICMNRISEDAINMMYRNRSKDLPKMSRDLSEYFTQMNVNDTELIGHNEQTENGGISILVNNKQLSNNQTVCYVSHGEINKKYDVKELVRYLSSINEYIDKILVETVNNENNVEDCLTYFFYPYDENIRSKIREKSFNPDFKLKWGGRHLSSLKALIRLLTNTNEDATVENVFDSSEGDCLSRDYVSLRDDKSPIWKPVEKVFGKNVHNANINKKASPDTISKNESEIQAIINIVFACKKKHHPSH